MGLQASAGFIAPDLFENIVETDRNLIRANFSHVGACHPDDFKLTTGPGMSGSVSGGRYVLRNRENTKQGYYMAWGDTAETKTWPAASSLPRIDTLVLRVADPQYGTLAVAPGAYLDIVQGTPASSPVAVSDGTIGTTYRVPGTWERLYDVAVPASPSTTLGAATDKRLLASAPGGVALAANATGYGNGSFLNEVRSRTDAGRFERWNGSAWRVEQNLVLGGVTPNALLGAVPDFVAYPMQLQVGTTQVVLGSAVSGQASVAFPRPFPGGVMAVFITDAAAAAGYDTYYTTQNTDLNGFSLIARRLSTGAPVDGLRQINMLAFGW